MDELTSRALPRAPSDVFPSDHIFSGLKYRGYGAVLCDPPWRFRTWSETNQDRSASRYYSLMTLEEIKALPVRDLAADHCALFMWAVNPMIPHAFEVLGAWGFKFKTVAFTWVKTKASSSGLFIDKTDFHMGLGHWTRHNTEQVLLATRGTPRRLAKDVRQLVVAPRREHSRKPDEVRQRIERIVGGPYLELFARERAAGWDAFGNEVTKFDSVA